MTSPPSWIAELADRVAAGIQGFELLSPLACHIHHNDALDQWELSLFPSATEIVGGRYDGLRTTSRFALDLATVYDAFDTISAFHWQAQRISDDDDLGPHVSIEGTVGDHLVWVRVLATPPARFEPGRSLNTAENRFEERW